MSLPHGKLYLRYSSVLFEKWGATRTLSQTEHLNISGITFHGTDSFCVKLTTIAHPIPKISSHLTIFWGGTWRTEFVTTIHRQEGTSSENKSNEFHKKCSIELWTILMFKLLLCYVCVCVYLFPSTVEASPDWNKTINVMPEIRPAMLCWGNDYVSSTFITIS